MTREVSLNVNKQSIPLDYFIQTFIDHTVGGIVASLEGTGEVKQVEVSLEGDKVAINLNGASVQVNAFVSKIIRNTIVGMVSTLKGVGQVQDLQLRISR